ncbi:MAG: class I mannose-6-phosphate isomerase [Alicyclobacillus sp.]|nr:class I mannose-6-phosphate isomerase [Alicyclobacillus sp.]
MPHAFEPIKLRPIATPRMWGGHAWKSRFGVEHMAEPVGEYWLVSAHPSSPSVVDGGTFNGMTLQQVTLQYPEAFLGRSPQPRFPLLVKLIEAQADLSVQVHPEDAYAQQHEGDYGKTEAWYILETSERGRVVYGHRFRDRDDYHQAVRDGRVRDYLGYREIHPGDVVYVPAGTLHALLAGTTLIEVQQTSDVTYRVYDWDRIDVDGKPRLLHVDKAADVLRYGGDRATDDRDANGEAFTQGINEGTGAPTTGVTSKRLLACPYFQMEEVSVAAEGAYRIPAHAGPTVLIGVRGAGSIGWPEGGGTVNPGTAWVVPSGRDDVMVRAENGVRILRVVY